MERAKGFEPAFIWMYLNVHLGKVSLPSSFQPKPALSSIFLNCDLTIGAQFKSIIFIVIEQKAFSSVDCQIKHLRLHIIIHA